MLVTDRCFVVDGTSRCRIFNRGASPSLDCAAGPSANCDFLPISAASKKSLRGALFSGPSTMRLGRMRPLGVLGVEVEATTVGASALFGANIALAARSKFRSNSARGALVSNNRTSMPGPVVRPGRRRISTVKEGIGGFKFVLDSSDYSIESHDRPSLWEAIRRKAIFGR